MLHDFVMKTLHNMVRLYSAESIRQAAASYVAKGWIDDGDLVMVEEWLAHSDEPEEEA